MLYWLHVARKKNPTAFGQLSHIQPGHHWDRPSSQIPKQRRAYGVQHLFVGSLLLGLYNK
jgi:hypothetical protein